MSIEIRSFLNTDAAQVVQVWNKHHQAAGEAQIYDARTFEDSVFSKLFFEPDNLLIAIDEGSICGFLHAMIPISEQAGAQEGGMNCTATIAALCVLKQANENEVARSLIDAATRLLHSRNCDLVRATTTTECYSFYTGLGAGYGLIGVPQNDDRLSQWLTENGFKSISTIESWNLNLATFRTVMDRIQIQIRRQGRVARLAEDDHRSWWRSVALGHVEELVFKLQTNIASQASTQLRFWQLHAGQSPTETVGATPTTNNASNHWFFMEMPLLNDTADAPNYAYFLIAESLKNLMQERVPWVATTVDASNRTAIELLRKLGFKTGPKGIVFEKPLV